MSNQVILPENLTIHHIKQHFDELKTQVQGETESLTFDAGRVENIDTSGLQMLLVLVKDLQARNVSLNWLNLNDTIKESAQSIGLDQALVL